MGGKPLWPSAQGLLPRDTYSQNPHAGGSGFPPTLLTATIAGPHGQKRGWETITAQYAGFVNVSLAGWVINPARWAVVVSHPRFWPRGTSLWRSLSQHSLDEVSFFPCIKLECNKWFSDSANIYGGAETNNEFLGEIGAALWTSLGDGEVPVILQTSTSYLFTFLENEVWNLVMNIIKLVYCNHAWPQLNARAKGSRLFCSSSLVVRGAFG